MMRLEHWEPPDPPKLLVSAKRVALELDVPNWKANEICWCLERVFYAPGQAHYRVTRAFRERGELPPADLDREGMDHIYWMSRQRRRW